MKINDRSIRGIFIYSDDAVFEKGDFVLDGSYLYVCQADTSVGEKPSEATNKFSLYVGGEFATEEDQLNMLISSFLLICLEGF